jgi:hypothetical protein
MRSFQNCGIASRLLCLSRGSLFGLMIWGLAIIGATDSVAQSQNRKLFIRESDFVISPEEASRFSLEVMSPILDEFVKGYRGPQALRRRILTLIQWITQGDITFIAAPAYFPNRALHVVAKVERYQSKRLVIVFIPEMMDLRSRMSALEFRYVVLIALAHEMIHLELADENHSENQAAKDEAIAWAKTVLEIIRPLEAQGLITLPEFKQLSSRLKSVNDDYRDQRWLKNFRLP